MAADLKTKVKGQVLAVKDLPTLPSVLDDVQKLLKDPMTSTEQIARVISMDQVLSAKVLKMVNSPIYGFPGRISTIQHALVLLGYNVIRGIIMATSVFDIMAKHMKGLWEHSLGCALATGAVARIAGIEDADEFSVAGLLHDLGKVVIAVQMPKVHTRILQYVQEKDVTYYTAEKRGLGFAHDKVNAWLGAHWRLPLNIREGMAYHHVPDRAPNHTDVAAAVHIGDFLVRVFENGNGGDDQVLRLNPNALKILDIKVYHLEKVMDELCEQFIEMEDVSL